MPRVTGLLSWYQENPSWLSAAVSSAAKVCDSIIAVDGPYALFPDANKFPKSGPEQSEAIVETCNALNLDLMLHIRNEPWWGNELEKRDFMFRLGETVPSDWYFVIDGDEVLTHVPPDIHKRLAETEADAAVLTLIEREANLDLLDQIPSVGRDHSQWLRRFFRVLPDMHIVGTHWTVNALKDGKRVWLAGSTQLGLEPAADFSDIRLENRTKWRDRDRFRKGQDYYRRRDELGIETWEMA